MQSLIVPAGATIFRAGDPSLAVYVIEDGEVAISVGESGSVFHWTRAADHCWSRMWRSLPERSETRA